MGGVWLVGLDIIKVYYFRVVDEKDKFVVNIFVICWEVLGDLNFVVDILLCGCYW